MNSYSRLLYFVKPYYKRMIFAVFCMIVAAAAYLVVPWLIKNVVDQVLDEKNMFMLNLIVGAIILIFLIRGFCYLWPNLQYVLYWSTGNYRCTRVHL